MMIALLLASLLAWPLPTPPTLLVVLIHDAADPADDWTDARSQAALRQARNALAWWEAQTGDAAPILGPVIVQGVAAPFDRASWMDTTPGIFIVARAGGGPTLARGRSGWAKPGGWRLAVLETPAAEWVPLAALIAHEWGHAAYKLPDILTDGDIMGPGYPGAYAAGRVGCASLQTLGGGCVYVPLVQQARITHEHRGAHAKRERQERRRLPHRQIFAAIVAAAPEQVVSIVRQQIVPPQGALCAIERRRVVLPGGYIGGEGRKAQYCAPISQRRAVVKPVVIAAFFNGKSDQMVGYPVVKLPCLIHGASCDASKYSMELP